MSNHPDNSPAVRTLMSDTNKKKGGKIVVNNNKLYRQAFGIVSKVMLDALRVYSLCLLQENGLSEISTSPGESLSSAVADLCANIAETVLCSTLEKIALEQESKEDLVSTDVCPSEEVILADCRRWLFAMGDPLIRMKSKNSYLSEESIFSDCRQWFFAEGDLSTVHSPQKELPLGFDQIKTDDDVLAQRKAKPPQKEKPVKKPKKYKKLPAQRKGEKFEKEFGRGGKASNHFTAKSFPILTSSDEEDSDANDVVVVPSEWINMQLSQTWASTSQEDTTPKKKKSSKIKKLFSCMFSCFRRKSQRVAHSD